jgi:hypothetical protein
MSIGADMSAEDPQKGSVFAGPSDGNLFVVLTKILLPAAIVAIAPVSKAL